MYLIRSDPADRIDVFLKPLPIGGGFIFSATTL
jgi:hypothetical protein